MFAHKVASAQNANVDFSLREQAAA